MKSPILSHYRRILLPVNGRVKMNLVQLLLLSALLLLQIAPGFAQNADSTKVSKKVAPWFVERFSISAGYFAPVNNTSIQVGIKGNDGTKIDFEKDLGFNAHAGVVLTDFQWRASRRSRFNFGYYNIQRSSDHTLQKDITFDTITYHANANIHAFFNTAIYQFSYGYAIVAKPNFELGLRIGVHTLGGKVGIALNSTNFNLSKSSKFDFTAPLPDLGIWAGYAISKKFAVNLEAEYLALTVGDISGSIKSYNLAVMYKLLDRLRLSAAYTGLDFSVDAVANKANGHFKWGYNGPALAATFTFGKKSWQH